MVRYTDQYLLWSSEHPTIHKMSVIRSLMDRAHSVITEEGEIKKEEEHIKQALKMCQYPDWTFNKTKEKMEEAKLRGKNTKRKDKIDPGRENRGMVTLPYIKGVTERIQRVFHKYRIQAPVKPHLKLRNLLVHPKDKIETGNKCNVIYELPCKSCDKSYIGETGRMFKTRLGEHRKECEKVGLKIRTRSVAQETEAQCLKSAVSEHCGKENHIMNWEDCKILESESNKKSRWIKESMWLRKRGKKAMNRDEGGYMLSKAWNTVLSQEGQTH